jgi:DME family drug/metabolite transporter
MLKYSIFVILAGMCWGTTGTLQALAPAGASALTVGSIRVAGAGLILFVYSMLTKGADLFRRGWSFKGFLLAVIGQVGYQLSFFSAVKLTGVTLGTMITIGSSPAIAGMLGLFFFKERLSMMWLASTSIAVVGCCMLAFGNSGGPLRIDFWGCALALFAAFAYALLGVGIRVIGKHDPIEVISILTATSGLAVLPLLVGGDMEWMFSVHGLGIVLALCVVSTILPYALFIRAVQFVPLGMAYTLSLTEPLTASTLAVFVLGEKISITSAIGIALILFSVCVLTSGSSSVRD